MYRLLLLPFYIGKIVYYFFMSLFSFIIRPFSVTYNNKKVDNKDNYYHLSEYEKKIAKEEMLDYEEYIEAEERDDDYLDTDED